MHCAMPTPNTSRRTVHVLLPGSEFFSPSRVPCSRTREHALRLQHLCESACIGGLFFHWLRRRLGRRLCCRRRRHNLEQDWLGIKRRRHILRGHLFCLCNRRRLRFLRLGRLGDRVRRHFLRRRRSFGVFLRFLRRH